MLQVPLFKDGQGMRDGQAMACSSPDRTLGRFLTKGKYTYRQVTSHF